MHTCVSLNRFNDEFLEYLRHFIFTGDIFAVKEGTPVFPYEPLIRVKAKIIEAQLLETAMLLCVNHQTLIATKAKRIVKAAQGRAIMEFGARRAHNFDAANYGARAAFIGGVQVRQPPMPDRNSVCRFWEHGTFLCTVL